METLGKWGFAPSVMGLIATSLLGMSGSPIRTQVARVLTCAGWASPPR